VQTSYGVNIAECGERETRQTLTRYQISAIVEAIVSNNNIHTRMPRARSTYRIELCIVGHSRAEDERAEKCARAVQYVQRFRVLGCLRAANVGVVRSFLVAVTNTT
jgi:hypothetical protein